MGIEKKLRFIESIRTLFKIVICSKISPEFEGVPTTDCHSLYFLDENFFADIRDITNSRKFSVCWIYGIAIKVRISIEFMIQPNLND